MTYPQLVVVVIKRQHVHLKNHMRAEEQRMGEHNLLNFEVLGGSTVKTISYTAATVIQFH